MKKTAAAIAMAIATLIYVVMAVREANDAYPREYRDVYEQIRMERMITG